jgi:gas vesicle protein
MLQDSGEKMENIIRTGNTDGKNPVRLLAGILVGGLASFGILLLLASRSGRRTRAQITLKSAELRGRVEGTFNDLLRLAYFDHREIQARTREEAERVRDHASLALKTEEQALREQLLDNDSLGG